MANGEDAADDVLLYFMLMLDGGQRLYPYVLALTGQRMEQFQEATTFAPHSPPPTLLPPPAPLHLYL